jgi:hypothetical protein
MWTESSRTTSECPAMRKRSTLQHAPTARQYLLYLTALSPPAAPHFEIVTPQPFSNASTPNCCPIVPAMLSPPHQLALALAASLHPPSPLAVHTRHLPHTAAQPLATLTLPPQPNTCPVPSATCPPRLISSHQPRIMVARFHPLCARVFLLIMNASAPLCLACMHVCTPLDTHFI